MAEADDGSLIMRVEKRDVDVSHQRARALAGRASARCLRVSRSRNNLPVTRAHLPHNL